MGKCVGFVKKRRGLDRVDMVKGMTYKWKEWQNGICVESGGRVFYGDTLYEARERMWRRMGVEG